MQKIERSELMKANIAGGAAKSTGEVHVDWNKDNGTANIVWGVNKA